MFKKWKRFGKNRKESIVGSVMRNANLLIWVTQLGLSVAIPLVGFILLAVWLQQRWALGNWILLLGVGLGIFCAIDGLVCTLKILSRMSRDDKKEPPAVSFNDHE